MAQYRSGRLVEPSGGDVMRRKPPRFIVDGLQSPFAHLTEEQRVLARVPALRQGVKGRNRVR